MKRKVIRIDEAKCNGCGLCIPNCPEGAMKIIDGKARLVSDSLCDGLGACLGHCPEGAISVEERETGAYDERRVMENMMAQEPGVVQAHLEHLREHNERENLQIALAVLREKGMVLSGDAKPQPGPDGHGPHFQGCPTETGPSAQRGRTSRGTLDESLRQRVSERSRDDSGKIVSGCPGSKAMSFNRTLNCAQAAPGQTQEQPSSLSHWPIQLHLINPAAPHYRKSDLLLAADCAAFSAGNFHAKFLSGKTLAIGCPKLDSGQEIYLEKLTALIDEAGINTLTVLIMEVPCCGGLLRLAQEAVSRASRKIPVKLIMLGLEGNLLKEEWV